MIRNNLSILLAERGMKATQLANDTGIARSTLSKITNNNSEKIDYGTINAICRRLKITPCEFFEYLPYDASYFVSIDEELAADPKDGPLTWKIDAFLNIDSDTGKLSFEYSGQVTSFGSGPNGSDALQVFLNPANEEEELKLKSFFKKVPASFTSDIHSAFLNAIDAEIKNDRFSPYRPNGNDYISLELFNFIEQ